jgi:hypothetical protein
MSASIPAMTITIQIRDGMTVRLDYDPALEAALPAELRQSLVGRFVSCSRVTIANQRGAQSFDNVMLDAASLLFAYMAGRQYRPAELRPATTQKDEP